MYRAILENVERDLWELIDQMRSDQPPLPPEPPKVGKMLKLQGLPTKLSKLKHDTELEAGKLSDRIDGVHARKDAAFSKGHEYLNTTEADIGAVEQFVKDLEAATNGAPE